MSKPAFEDIFTFEGRRNRKSYIIYNIVVFIIAFIIATIITLIGMATAGIGLVLYVLLLPLVISSWAVGGQRCRDFGWSGWAILISFIPYIGLLFILALMFIPGNQGENRYGPDPLQSA